MYWANFFFSWWSTCGNLECFQDFLGLTFISVRITNHNKLTGPEITRNIDSFLLIGPGEIFKALSARPSDLSILRNILKMKWCM